MSELPAADRPSAEPAPAVRPAAEPAPVGRPRAAPGNGERTAAEGARFERTAEGRPAAEPARAGTAVVWVHADSLSPLDPALAANPGAPAIFVFDDVVLEGYAISLKRVQFIYECLLELPVVLRRGGVAGEVVAFAREHGADRVVSTWTPAPRFSHLRGLIQQTLPVEVVEPTPFAVMDREPSLARFSSFWREAQRDAFRPSTEPRIATPTLPGFDDAPDVRTARRRRGSTRPTRP